MSMSISTVADWDNEYARLARSASQLRAQGHQSTMTDHRALQQGLQRLDQALLTGGVAAALSPPEVQRRRRLVQHLQSSPQLQQQDEMLDDLAAGVGRLKAQTQLIGEEAKLHLGLLGDMEQQVDLAQDGLESETARAQRLQQDASIWKLQLTVAGLSVLLVLLIVTGLLP